MEQFLKKHDDKLVGAISTFDRVIFKGHLGIGRPELMTALLQQNGLLIRDFKGFVEKQSQVVKAHVGELAAAAGRPLVRLRDGDQRKEEYARQLAARDGVSEGLVCVLSAVEATGSFRVLVGDDRPRLVRVHRKCLCYYCYFIDPQLGWLHVRLPSWFPFPIQFCVHGHEVLARDLTAAGVTFRQATNCLAAVDDVARAQELADRFPSLPWPTLLNRYARLVNPLLDTLLAHDSYYYLIDQAEFATDLIFRDPAALAELYPNLLRHAVTCFGADDVMTFLGRKLTAQFQGELATFYNRRWPGARIKHRMKGNWIKMRPVQ